jgi:hypothetical protein
LLEAFGDERPREMATSAALSLAQGGGNRTRLTTAAAINKSAAILPQIAAVLVFRFLPVPLSRKCIELATQPRCRRRKWIARLRAAACCRILQKRQCGGTLLASNIQYFRGNIRLYLPNRLGLLVRGNAGNAEIHNGCIGYSTLQFLKKWRIG